MKYKPSGNNWDCVCNSWVVAPVSGSICFNSFSAKSLNCFDKVVSSLAEEGSKEEVPNVFNRLIRLFNFWAISM